MTNEIIPFGKYKGRPIEDAAADRQYSDWLMEQQWFRERFTALYATMAALHQPAETPEHNAMQARFLDAVWCEAIVRALKITVVSRETFPDLPKHLWAGPWPKAYKVTPARFEQRGADVELVVADGTIPNLRIELKPVMGDDYPAVLRQVVASQCNVVVVGYFQAEGATIEQVKEIFQRSRVMLILQSEIEEQKGW